MRAHALPACGCLALEQLYGNLPVCVSERSWSKLVTDLPDPNSMKGRMVINFILLVFIGAHHVPEHAMPVSPEKLTGV